MRRLFVSLYLALVAAFVICAIAVPWLFQKSLQRPLAQYGEQLSAAPQFLFEQELGVVLAVFLSVFGVALLSGVGFLVGDVALLDQPIAALHPSRAVVVRAGMIPELLAVARS